MSRQRRVTEKGRGRRTGQAGRSSKPRSEDSSRRSSNKQARAMPRIAPGTRLVMGWNPVLEALRAGAGLQNIWLAAEQHKQAEELLQLANKRAVHVEVVERQTLSALTESEEHQGVAASGLPFSYSTVDEMLRIAREKDEQPFLLILDHIEDPHNLGSLIRTAECAGVHGVIIPNRRAASVTAAVGKASAGAVEHMRVAQVVNVVQELERLKGLGLWSVGAHMTGDSSLFEADLSGPTVLVIGSEGKGLSRLVAERCDMLVSIPMFGRINSLNASVAGALLMYEVARSRIRNTSGSVTL